MKGIDNTHLFNANMIATADLDKEVVVSYAAIHCGLTNEMIENYEDYPSKEEMIQQLTDKRLGYDFKKDVPYDWAKLSRKKDKTKGIEKYWLADLYQEEIPEDCSYSVQWLQALLLLWRNHLIRIVLSEIRFQNPHGC